MYKVKEVADMLNVSEHTIRYYDQIGLIPYVERDLKNRRIFNQKAINWIKGLVYLKSCGMGIEALKAYVELCMSGNQTASLRKEIILKQKEIVDQKMQELQKSAQFLEQKLQYYDEVIEGKRQDNSNPSNW